MTNCVLGTFPQCDQGPGAMGGAGGLHGGGVPSGAGQGPPGTP